MQERPGRLLPSVIVGGLLLSGLALGAGTASAAAVGADQCLIGSDLYDIKSTTVSKSGDKCSISGVVVTSIVGVGAGLLEKAKDAASEPSTTVDTAAGTVTKTDPDSTTDTKADAGAAGTGNGAGTSTSAGSGNASAPARNSPAPAPAIAAAPAPLRAAAPVAAAGPVGSLPALAGVAPAGLASSLFSANSYDPGLLFGSPLGNAASALFSPKPDSAVTTVSQAQALNAPTGNGYGTPATIGVIILACLVGFAVRHRVISRMKSREVPVDHEPRHAAPEVDETQAPEDARTMVVLTSR